MQTNLNLTQQTVRVTALQILHACNEWIQNQTTLTVQRLQQPNCQVFLIEVNTISSTMLLSQNWPRDQLKTNSGHVVFAFRADQQTQGRGQKLNCWQSPKGNLYLTLLVGLDLGYFPFLSLLSVTCLFQVIQRKIGEGKIIKIKWINDVLVDFEKVAGVLVRGEIQGNRFMAEIGIGVNLNVSPKNVSQPVSSLSSLTNCDIPVRQFGLEVIQQFIRSLYEESVQITTKRSHLLYEKNLAYLNRYVAIMDEKYEKVLGEGVFQGVNQYGHAKLKGCDKQFMSGRMRMEKGVL